MKKYESMLREHRDKSYVELLCMRDELIERIKNFEKNRLDNTEVKIDPLLETNYIYDSNDLSELCKFIVEKYNEEFRLCADNDRNGYIFQIRDFLISNGLMDDSLLIEQMKERKSGKKYSIVDHIRGIIYAMLTNQTKWHNIAPHLSEIDELFSYYDPEILKTTSAAYFTNKLFEIKCGNINTAAQMNALAYDINVFELIEKEYGSVDEFVLSAPAYQIVQELSKGNSRYKLKMMGEALAWEYLRNVGIDGAKPDIHLCRFYSGKRMGDGNHNPATSKEVYNCVLKLSEITGLSMTEIDNYIWSYCADGYGEVCTADPRCNLCVIRYYCKYRESLKTEKLVEK